ncbi:MAG: type II toxin-antitoxin system HicA family toxin [Candidatus Aenigmarchaeota archaeon]|nr:type II toxin-antitoxin system HicA family toxin [Candidatus Aenigmarchaeota archaeon]
MNLPSGSRQKMIRILYMQGFQIVRQRSSHVQMKDAKGRFVTVLVHSGMGTNRSAC